MENLNVNQEMNFDEMANVVGGWAFWIKWRTM
jgi:bacteriocin-like protein